MGKPSGQFGAAHLLTINLLDSPLTVTTFFARRATSSSPSDAWTIDRKCSSVYLVRLRCKQTPSTQL